MTAYAFIWTYGKNTYGEIGGYNGSDPKEYAIGRVHRFDSAAQRDEWVSVNEERREAVTRKEAEKLAPDAFRLAKLGDYTEFGGYY
jgi:hypothetical protein